MRNFYETKPTIKDMEKEIDELNAKLIQVGIKPIYPEQPYRAWVIKRQTYNRSGYVQQGDWAETYACLRKLKRFIASDRYTKIYEEFVRIRCLPDSGHKVIVL